MRLSYKDAAGASALISNLINVSERPSVGVREQAQSRVRRLKTTFARPVIRRMRRSAYGVDRNFRGVRLRHAEQARHPWNNILVAL